MNYSKGGLLILHLVIEYLRGKKRDVYHVSDKEDAKKLIDSFEKIDINSGLEDSFKYKIKKVVK